MTARPRRLLLPAELAALDGWPAPRRTVRDWAADAVLFGFSAVMWAENLDFPPEGVDFVPGWMAAVNPWAGALACLALWWRRRLPVLLAVAMVPALLVSGSALGAAMAITLTVAVHRPWPRAATVTVAYLMVVGHYALFGRPPGVDRPVIVATTLLLFVVPFCLGTAVRARRLLVVSLWHDAQVQRREHLLGVKEARRAERERLAREMHDVLAHRMSLLSVHAGALAYRTARAASGDGPPLGAAEVGQAAEVIRDNARRALDELAEVLAVLRSDEAATGETGPHHRLADIPALVAEAEAAGQRVLLRAGAGTGASPPRHVEQAAYRVVQEGLTNARKHAPGVPVTVRIEGEPGGVLTVSVENPLEGVRDSAGTGGNGLAGLAERVALTGGTLEHERLDRSFRLTARLPWQA
ncbi:histidine kinase [Microbispora sp. NPDC046933]|uniref:sensor histidine kinase n=1 Tax=Microbispora sp. NPDC046933 TaxID=3155618 RepID=UPI003401DD54